MWIISSTLLSFLTLISEQKYILLRSLECKVFSKCNKWFSKSLAKAVWFHQSDTIYCQTSHYDILLKHFYKDISRTTDLFKNIWSKLTPFGKYTQVSPNSSTPKSDNLRHMIILQPLLHKSLTRLCICKT